MKAASLNAEITAGLLDLAWNLWSQLGVSAARPAAAEHRAIDPEALLLFTLEVGRSDPRLLDETLDWLVTNEPLVSVQRLRNLARDETDRALVDAALAWTALARRTPQRHGATTEARDGGTTPLFYGLATSGARDPSFAQHGLDRPLLRPSTKSQAPDLQAPIAFAFRLRRLLGLGVRAEIVRTLLTIRAPHVSASVLAADSGFAARNVRDGVRQLQEAGVLSAATVGADRRHWLDPSQWATLLGLATPDLPFHHDWIPSLRSLTALRRWLQQPGLDDLSDYMLASRARTVYDEIEGDLRSSGVPAAHSPARSEMFWDEFVATARRAVQVAAGGDPSRG